MCTIKTCAPRPTNNETHNNTNKYCEHRTPATPARLDAVGRHGLGATTFIIILHICATGERTGERSPMHDLLGCLTFYSILYMVQPDNGGDAETRVNLFRYACAIFVCKRPRRAELAKRNGYSLSFRRFDLLPRLVVQLGACARSCQAHKAGRPTGRPQSFQCTTRRRRRLFCTTMRRRCNATRATRCDRCPENWWWREGNLVGVVVDCDEQLCAGPENKRMPPAA